eukprot:CAMPEP_0206284962 /NCGR_PEP_ID=MMETSP0047_2-20121206/41058_1 /ASSEMBLY_ACC=CAM_ASM_000192 /TAXON_ID=195065 /ORGANISM="Chroomonas mesostigmatica_cf, Strain CCMP1168" /LENGTH=97 /DNA_ID=CAMNT_0053715459 /DNA_START=1063 /DNA_END=1356 /DNA_ORIENTATION=-
MTSSVMVYRISPSIILYPFFSIFPLVASTIDPPNLPSVGIPVVHERDFGGGDEGVCVAKRVPRREVEAEVQRVAGECGVYIRLLPGARVGEVSLLVV